MAARKKFHTPAYYRIKLQGHLDPKWSEWFAKMRICTEGDNTILAGLVVDQAALRGVLTRIGDLNLTLLSVERIEKRSENKSLITKEET